MRREHARRAIRRRLNCEHLESRRLLAVDLQQVVNLNTTDPWSSILEFAQAGDKTFFIASEPDSTRLDLWSTDGTSAGTQRLVDMGQPVPGDFGAKRLVSVGETLYFHGYDEAHGHELWKSDGTPAGTVMVRDLRAGPASSTVTGFTELNGKLLFSGNGHLFRSDGTTAGTFRLADLQPGASDDVANLTVVGNTAFFTAKQSDTGANLFKTNGTSAGTQRVLDAAGDAVDDLAAVNDTLFFTRDGRSLWKSNGSEAGTVLVTDFTSSPFGAYPAFLTDVNGELFFVSGGDLWKSDGTEAGTQFIKNTGNYADTLFNFNGTLYFSAGTRQLGEGYELWKSDGTATGTVQVIDLSPGFFEGYGDSSYPAQFTEFEGKLLFTATQASTSSLSRGIWTTDGTAAGTTLIEDGFVSAFIPRNGELLFAHQHSGPNTTGLWKSDGTPNSAVEIPRLGPGAGNANPTNPVLLNGALYFAASDSVHGQELWKRQGNSVSLVKDIAAGQAGAGIANLMTFQGVLYFTANDGVNGQELWRSDGTAEGTFRLSDMVNSLGGAPRDLTPLGNLLLFVGIDDEGAELWKTDGTAAGTMRVKDIHPGQDFDPYYGVFPNSSSPGGFSVLNGTLYFSATSAETGRELWKSDGTTEGTVLVKDLSPGQDNYYPYEVYSSSPGAITNLGGILYFVASNGENGRGLWKSDGTAEGTVLIKGALQGLSHAADPVAVGRYLYFAGTDAAGSELWKSDGTTAGTVRVKDIRAGSLGSDIRHITVVKDKIFFVAGDGTTGRELWQSDGTEAGTHLVKDIRQGLSSSHYPVGSNPEDLIHLNGVLFFTADDGLGGRELWKSTGVTGETVQVKDLLPGSQGSSPDHLTVLGNDLYFSAESPFGRELWRARSQAPTVTISTDVLTHREGNAGVRVAGGARVTDGDNAVFRGGQLRATVAQNYRLGDRLLISPTSVITLNGNLVLYKQVVIGQFRSDAPGRTLIVDLNLNATVASVQALLGSVMFRTDSDNPTAAQRSIRLELTDGDGGIGRATRQVAVTPVNDAPTISPSTGGTLNYQAGSTPVPILPLAVVNDADSNFGGARLLLRYTSGYHASNRLGTGNGFTFVGDNLVYNGVTIGTRNINGGVGTQLEVTFNASASRTLVQQFVRSLRFSTLGPTTTTPRTLELSLRDVEGAVSNRVVTTVNVVP